jgi:hypothetical protein
MFLHELPDAKDLFLVISEEKAINPSIVEKDYWVMHALWGLQQQAYDFELKGGTSLSKGYDIINRFSEDIDIQIHPDTGLNLKTGKNHDRPNHIEGRRNFFDDIAKTLNICGLTFDRDHEFDDIKMRGAGIRGLYHSHFQALEVLKEGILFEVGFDKTTPFEHKDISSWAYDKAKEAGISLIDNRAKSVKCYLPEYTFIEKLQTISTKYRKNKNEKNESPVNFIRHYYDIYMLLKTERVLKFIQTDNYQGYKKEKFGQAVDLDITKNPAFQLTEIGEMEQFSGLYNKKSEIYFGNHPPFQEIIDKIKSYADVL